LTSTVAPRPPPAPTAPRPAPRPPAAPSPTSRRPALRAAVLVAASIAVYLPALVSAGFIWNDSDYVTAAGLRGWAGLGRIWLDLGATQQYYPLLHTAFWVQHALWGDGPLGYHLANLGLHAAGAVLFYQLIRRAARLGPASDPRRIDDAAWLAALLFAVHPVNGESVAWISEEKNTLSLVAYVLAALAYLRFDADRRPASYALASAAFVAALLCKAVTATLPAALLVLLWWRRGRLSLRRDGAPLAPWLVLGAAGGLFSGWVERTYGGARGTYFDLSALQRILVAGRAVCFYAWHAVAPVGLNFIYPRWTPDPNVAWQWLFPAAVAAAGLVLWALRSRSRGPLAVFLLFVGSLFPALGFVNLYGARYSFVWDHWQYLPDLALFAAIGIGIAAGLDRWRARPPGTEGAAVVVLLVVLGGPALLHAGMFRDNVTLYTETIARNPDCWMAYDNLGCEMDLLPGRRDEAMAFYERALRLNPDLAEAHNNLGRDLEQSPGRLKEAEAHYREALRIAPDFAPAHVNLGNALREEGRLPEALAEYREALRYKADSADAYDNLANALNAAGRPEEALADFQESVRLNPGDARARTSLGLQLAGLPGRADEALAQFNAALALDPQLPEAHANLGLLLAGRPGRLDEAMAQFIEAIRLRPEYAQARFYYGNVLVQAGRVPEAIGQYEEALRIDATLVEAANNLGIVLCRVGRVPEGLASIERALKASPQFAPAHFSRGVALLQSGRRDEARSEFAEVLRLRPGDPDAQRMLTLIQGGAP
jgi:tetratricopeptide (TPR) repeat protein